MQFLISLLLTLPPLFPTRTIWTLADDRVIPFFVRSEQVITPPLKPAVVLSVNIMETSGRDLEILNVVEFTDIEVVVILVLSDWNALVTFL